MKFNFELNGIIKGLTPRREQLYFEKARGKDPKVNALDCGIHREWVRMVCELFADKAELKFAQAVQIMKHGNFNPCNHMHGTLGQNAPVDVFDSFGKKTANPFRIRQIGLAEMEKTASHDFHKEAWLFAVSLVHPQARVGYRGNSSEYANEYKLAQKLSGDKGQHRDETRRAHYERTIAALKKHQEGDPLGAAFVYAGLETVGDLHAAGERAVESMSMKLR